MIKYARKMNEEKKKQPSEKKYFILIDEKKNGIDRSETKNVQ